MDDFSERMSTGQEQAVREGVEAPGREGTEALGSTANIPYEGWQNPPEWPQVSCNTVVLPNYCTGRFTYVSPSKIPCDAMRQDCIDAFIERAEEYLGTAFVEPYALAPGEGIDCSGLVLQCLYACGVDMGRYNTYNHRWCPSQTFNSTNWYKNGTFKAVDACELAAGDLVYYSGHVAIYVGAGEVIDSDRGIGVTKRGIRVHGEPIGYARVFVD